MRAMIQQNLINAFGGESQAHMRNTEKMHKMLCEKAQIPAAAGRDMALGLVYICNVCGYTVENEAPIFARFARQKKTNLPALTGHDPGLMKRAERARQTCQETNNKRRPADEKE